MPSYLKNKETAKGRGHASLHTHSQETGGYLIFDRSNISLLSIINGVWGFAFPVWDIEGIIAARMGWRYSESSHLLNHLFTGLGQRRERPGIIRKLRQTGQVGQELRFTHHVPQVVHCQFICMDTKRGLKIMDGNMLQVFFPN